MTNGEVHVTDRPMRRTMLYNIRDLQWDGHILQELGIPASMLPEVRPFIRNLWLHPPVAVAHISRSRALPVTNRRRCLASCVLKRHGKNTYGTGCFC